MTNGAAACGAAVAMYAIANATKATGAIVHVEPDLFQMLLQLQSGETPLVVFSPAGLFKKNQYLMAYKGLIFYTKTSTLLTLQINVELIQAKKIWIPNM